MRDVSSKSQFLTSCEIPPIKLLFSTSFFGCLYESTLHSTVSLTFVCIFCVQWLILEWRYYIAWRREALRKREKTQDLLKFFRNKITEKTLLCGFSSTGSLQNFDTLNLPNIRDDIPTNIVSIFLNSSIVSN